MLPLHALYSFGSFDFNSHDMHGLWNGSPRADQKTELQWNGDTVGAAWTMKQPSLERPVGLGWVIVIFIHSIFQLWGPAPMHWSPDFSYVFHSWFVIRERFFVIQFRHVIPEPWHFKAATALYLLVYYNVNFLIPIRKQCTCRAFQRRGISMPWWHGEGSFGRSWPGCCNWERVVRRGRHLLLWHSLGSQQAAHSAAVESQSHAAQSCAKVLWRGPARWVGCLFVQPLKYRRHPDRREQSFARLKINNVFIHGFSLMLPGFLKFQSPEARDSKARIETELVELFVQAPPAKATGTWEWPVWRTCLSQGGSLGFASKSVKDWKRISYFILFDLPLLLIYFFLGILWMDQFWVLLSRGKLPLLKGRGF